MKRLLTFSLVLVLSLFLLHGGNSLSSTPQPADPIQSIRQQYATINKGTRRYRKVKKELSGFSLEGGEMTAYFSGPAIVKIVANHFGESGRAVEEYYYSKGKLIFAFRKDYRYDRPMSGKVVSTQENRFYFQNDRLISWVNEDGRQVATATDEFKQKQDEYLESSSKFLTGARSKNATIEA
ncbi:MAG: hypothetical protein H7Z16_17835 [Pyrinomonadaceae bacterium]|nr:hypothetical protein [Pyrinomonadaceae bacterium]